MAVPALYPLTWLSDILPVRSCGFSIRRNDEQSGTGDGRFWTAQLSRPLWQVEVGLSDCAAVKGREINAKVWALEGTSRAFLFADPAYKPASGRATLPGVTVSAVSATRNSVSLIGLPASYSLTAGDLLAIAGPSGAVWFGALAETVKANASGAVSLVGVTPSLPAWVAAGQSVEGIKPYLRVIVPPGGFTPYAKDVDGHFKGASLTLLQKP